MTAPLLAILAGLAAGAVLAGLAAVVVRASGRPPRACRCRSYYRRTGVHADACPLYAPLPASDLDDDDTVRFAYDGDDRAVAYETVEIPDGGILVIRCGCDAAGPCAHVEALSARCVAERKMTVIARLDPGEEIEAITAEAMAEAGWIRKADTPSARPVDMLAGAFSDHDQTGATDGE